MKNLKRVIVAMFVLTLTVASFVLPAYAASTSDYQESVVYIGSTIRFTSSNYTIDGQKIVFTVSGTGTGFAAGIPGEKVQYIATCAHVVSEPKGVYEVILDASTKEVLSYEQAKEGTSYPEDITTKIDGRDCIVIHEYFNTEAVELRAIFSESENDYTKLTVAQIDEERDLAVCKLASKPTDKISAFPLVSKDDVEIGMDVVAIGYPSTSMYFNDEGRYDSSDSTVKDGIVSGMIRTKGMNGSKTTYDVYEVDAELITGMSGGPVFSDESGAIIGITTFGNIDASQAAAARYATCIDYLFPLLDAEGIDYERYEAKPIINLTLILIIGAAVLVVAILVVLIVLLTKSSKKKAPVVVAPQPAPIPQPMAQPKKYCILGIAGPLCGKKFAVTSSATIGRDATKCNIVFPSDTLGVSGLHCEISLSGNNLVLKDRGSSYGTFLENGTKLEPNVPVILTNGTKFYLSSTKVMFEVQY